MTNQYVTYSPTTGSTSAELATYASFGALPVSASNGDQAVTLDTHTLYIYNSGTATWVTSPATPGNLSGDITSVGLVTTYNGTLGTNKGGTGVTTVTVAPTATRYAGWDVNKNLSANSFIGGYTTTATAAGTTTLLVGSTQQQYFTGATTQTVLLPVTSTLVLGQSYTVVNNSSGVVTVQSSGANTIQAMAANTTATFTVILTSGTSAASWSYVYGLAAAVSGTVTSVSVASANGFAGSVATASTTPAITISTSITGLLKGNGTAVSAATVGTDYSVGTGSLATGILKSTTTTGALSIAAAGTDYSAGTGGLATGILKSTTTSGALTIAVAGDFPTLNQNTSGSAASLSATLNVATGGTGNTTFTAYSVLCAGTTSTGTFQNVSGVGTSGQVLTSNGASALPTWQAAGGGISLGPVLALQQGYPSSI